MKWFILIAVIFSNSFEAQAAKPLSCSDSPFCFTVQAIVNGKQIGMNISWDKKDSFNRDTSYQSAAYEMFHDTSYLFSEGDHIRFLIEYPRRGYDSFSVYACYENSVFTLHNSDGQCGYSANDQRVLEKIRLRKMRNE